MYTVILISNINDPLLWLAMLICPVSSADTYTLLFLIALDYALLFSTTNVALKTFIFCSAWNCCIELYCLCNENCY